MINFRLVNESDIEQIRKWRNSDLIKNVSYNRAYISQENQKLWFSNLENNKSQIHWIITNNLKSVGYACLKNIDYNNHRCEFASLYIGETEYLHSGIGAIVEFKILNYIFEDLEMNKVSCEVLSFNKKVIQLHKRFGFITEGILKEQYILDNQFENVHLLALFKKDWENKKAYIGKLLKI
ncbi:UDP-4-amino-4,6-dideoxy-N-acetyl-beta-L-altrosamine N-acetyltransferase [Apibacter sp. HY039]|uniref:UDP-4-amino-4, 6-dideoxy-N-acetyl-beta-L-altrosamine N-acetyltransferase n=1 Tax=Apibacter sp. HY039 TaxID=2501476 RepID=UPI000FEB607E|nr:UDP-4-amino-4,6-dideoxy-N-acetyl-beta-L-altrosamine N-acetyltransferase [Apibacter sp. HY039]